MKLRITLDLNDEQFNHLWRLAARYNFLREDPRRSWTDDEKKEAVRHVASEIVLELVKERMHYA